MSNSDTFFANIKQMKDIHQNKKEYQQIIIDAEAEIKASDQEIKRLIDRSLAICPSQKLREALLDYYFGDIIVYECPHLVLFD